MNGILVASIVLLWGVVILLAAVVFALTRQVGVLLERVAPAGALNTGKSLQPGEQAPSFQLETIAGESLQVGGSRGNGRSQLVFFVSPSCSVCEVLLPAIKDMAASEGAWLDIVLASDGDEADHADFVSRKGISELPYVVSQSLGRGFRVAQLPHGALIDAEGKVAASGLVNSREHLESLIEAKERGIGSIQEYLERGPGTRL